MLGAFLGTAGKAAEAPKPATNAPPAVKTLNTPRDFPAVSSKEDWQAQAKQIREQVLVSCGLWPLPSRPPLRTQIFGVIAAWVMVAGCAIKLSTPPSDSAKVK